MASAERYDKLQKCCCCHELCWNIDEDVVQCTCCERVYHKLCHYPRLLNVDNNDFRFFTCIMCENIKKCSEDLQKSNLLFGENAKKVIARILIELYCRAENTDFIKSCPNQDLYPMFYKKIGQPMSLGDIKQFLDEDRYQQVKFVMWDIRRVFTNALSYFSPGDPYYATARELNVYLCKMIDKWLPNLVL